MKKYVVLLMFLLSACAATETKPVTHYYRHMNGVFIHERCAWHEHDEDSPEGYWICIGVQL